MPDQHRSEPSRGRASGANRFSSGHSGQGGQRSQGGKRRESDYRGERGSRREERYQAGKPQREGYGRPRRDNDKSGSGGGKFKGQRSRDGVNNRANNRVDDEARKSSRPGQRQRLKAPELPDNIEAADLERGARAELRALGRENAQNVAKHLIMVQRLLDQDPERAYEHARYASSRAGRVAVVRETAGIAAYLAGHYTEALREIRAARRLSGLDLHRAIEADCERALGNHRKAVQVVQQADLKQADDIERSELAMVLSGIRHEMGQTELGLIVVEDAIRARPADRETLRRLHSVRADRLEDLGRHREAAAIRERIGPEPEDEEEIEVFDIEEDSEAELGEQAQHTSAAAESAEKTEQSGHEDAQADATVDAVDAADAVDVQDAGEAEDDAQWSASFAQRVEAEMAELLQEADICAQPAAQTAPEN